MVLTTHDSDRRWVPRSRLIIKNAGEAAGITGAVSMPGMRHAVRNIGSGQTGLNTERVAGIAMAQIQWNNPTRSASLTLKVMSFRIAPAMPAVFSAFTAGRPSGP
jgi:hypothetical protein